METAQLETLQMQKLVVPELRTGRYLRDQAEIEYSPALVRDKNGNVIVNVNRDKARELAASMGGRLSTAAEEQVLSEKGYKNAAFNDNFARNSQKTYFWQWTDTALLKPKGKKKYYRHLKNGREYWLRLVAEGGEVVGELWVPQGNGRVVRELSVYGLPSETVDEHRGGTETHWYFDPSLDEAAVLRGRIWDVVHRDCFGLDADHRPSHSSGGFRLVRGARPSYEKITEPSRKKSLSPEGASKGYKQGYKDGEKSGYDKGVEDAKRKLSKLLERL